MIVDLKTGDFWLIYHYLRVLPILLGLVVSEGSGCRQSSWIHSKRSGNCVVISIGSFSYSRCLVDLASRLDYSLLLFSVRWLMVFSDLIALVELLAYKDSSRISQVCSIADIVVNENDQRAASAVVALLLPLGIRSQEGLPQGSRYIFSPIRVKEILM